MFRKKAHIFILLLASCARADDDDGEPSGTPPPDAYVQTFAIAETRAQAFASPPGWVVSRDCTGLPADTDPTTCPAVHQGDSLLMTALAMGSASCAGGDAFEGALALMIDETGGGLYRHPTKKGDWSMDGAIAFLWGVAKRVERCPRSRAVWAPRLASFAQAVSLTPYWGAMRDEVRHELGDGGEPMAEARGKLGLEVAAWAQAVVDKHAAAYRIHLGFLTLDVVSAPASKATWCQTIAKAGMPIASSACGEQAGLDAWLSSFTWNAWEYGLQRSQVWETSPDGDGFVTPGVDFMVGLRRRYGSAF